MAAGYLGWTPEQSLDTPLPWVFLALEGRIDWIGLQNGKPARKKAEPSVAEKLKAFAKAKGAKRVSRCNGQTRQ